MQNSISIVTYKVSFEAQFVNMKQQYIIQPV